MKENYQQFSASKFLAGLLFFFLNIISASVSAQCPVANNCTPGNPPSGNLTFGMGIFNVNVGNGAINNTTLGASQGYQDFSCSIGANLFPGVSYPISIQTNVNVNENVRVWIDYNNDGAFNATTELAFSSNNNKVHTGTFTVPATATLNAPLRMRVSADNFTSPLPTPCSTPVYSQVEDYRVTVTANTNAPVAEFIASNTTTCSPTVTFTDLSQNGPTSWLWNFGDLASGSNNSSTLQNPLHTFSAPGVYTVSLTATNSIGSNTVTKTNYITYHTNVPVAAACTPVATGYCCGYGITNVNFGNGIMTNNSADGSAGYENFTCTKTLPVMAGNRYPFSITTGTNPQDTRIYIDLNNDGSFTGANEMVLELLNKVNPSDTLTIPATAITNTPLRMRIVSDAVGNNFTSCGGIQNGQAEDYTIIIAPNTSPPVARFTANPTADCDTIVQFIDQSTNGPTSWLWNFGDPSSGTNNTSTLQNPVHIFHNGGAYTVTLTVSNANGTSSLVKTNFKTVMNPCIIYCPVSGNNNNIHINNVTLGAINNTSGPGPNGYSDFTGMQATLIQGAQATLNVSRSDYSMTSGVNAWIDFNRNGTFELSEKVMNVLNSTGVAATTFSIPATATLGPTRMRIMTAYSPSSFTDPCPTNSPIRDTEDYTVVIETSQQPPAVSFSADNPLTCNGIVKFFDNSVNGATSWLWDFGDPASGASNTSTLQHPMHTYATPGLYTVTLSATNTFGTSQLQKTNYINYDPTNPFCTNVVMPATGTGPIATLCTGAIHDPGGATGQYPNNANSITTIAPSGANNITLTFTAFNLEDTEDILRVYDGPTIASRFIGAYTSTTIPAPITSTTGALTLHFTSSNSGQASGFSANWTCTPITAKPAALFKVNLDNICAGEAAFQDLSTNGATSWTWDFGDGSPVSNLQNPTHTYPTGTAANYPVKLIACNSFGCDTLTKQSYVAITSPCLTYCASSNNNNNQQWISNVQIGTINNASGPEVNGYGNYTYLSSNVTIGTPPVPITVTLGNKVIGNALVTIWVDFNQDGIFQTTERVVNVQASMPAGNAPRVATGSIIFPANVAIGSTRLRIITTPNTNTTNSCFSNLTNRAETEDYTLNILPTAQPTVAGFSANLNTICTGVVQFTDESTNGPTSWTWDFGDGSPVSNVKNPSHTYQTTTPNSYTVTLTACKGTQCDVEVKTNHVNIEVPCLTYCTATGNTTNQWISRVNLGTINNFSGAEPTGYRNYTYLKTDLITGTSNNQLLVTVGKVIVNNAYVYAWIDFNRDGVFSAAEKVVDAASANGNPLVATALVTVPSGALLGTTRMRVMTTSSGAQTSACPTSSPQGETEDYTVNIISNPLPPVANFSAVISNVCVTTKQFTDLTANAPTSWQWNFGDPASGADNTSTLQHPSHTYPNVNTNYTVTLIACKGTQCDTIVKQSYVPIGVPCPTYCNPSGNQNLYTWVHNVIIGGTNLANTLGQQALNGYGNYTNQIADLMINSSPVPLSVTVGPTNGMDTTYADVWIDFNKDGIFAASEKVMHGLALPLLNRVATGSFVIPGTVTPGPTRMRVIGSQNKNVTDPCVNNLIAGETEDYTINFVPSILPVANFSGTPTITCDGLVNFTDLSTSNPTTWQWNFGDPASGASNTSTLQNPAHTFSTPGTYTVSLTACNGAGCSPAQVKSTYITYDPNNIACSSVNMPVSGTTTRNTCVGSVFDNGGPTGPYTANVNSTLVIAPTGASSVALTFTAFALETGGDFVRIFDGPNTSSPSLGVFAGFTLPNNGLPIVSSGGALTINFITNNANHNTGFAANWSCVTGTGIAENLNASFDVYPNPASGFVTINVPGAATGDYNLEVLDVTGRKLISRKAVMGGGKTGQVDLSSLSKGIYFLRIHNEKGTGIKKIIRE